MSESLSLWVTTESRTAREINYLSEDLYDRMAKINSRRANGGQQQGGGHGTSSNRS